MKIISAGIQRRAVVILALTSFLLLNAFQAFAQDNSRASSPKGSVQKGDDHTFSHDVDTEAVNIEAVNPGTQVAGIMTVKVNGTVRGNRLRDGQSAVGSHLQGECQATFSFVPYYPYSPSYSATLSSLQVAGNTSDNSIFFDFGLKATGSDGSEQWFMLREVVTATEAGAHIAFKQLPLPDKLIAQPGLACGSVLH